MENVPELFRMGIVNVFLEGLNVAEHFSAKLTESGSGLFYETSHFLIGV